MLINYFPIIILGKDESSGYLFVEEGPSFNRNEGGTTPKV